MWVSKPQSRLKFISLQGRWRSLRQPRAAEWKETIPWSVLLREHFDTGRTATLPLMAFHRDSQLECQCFLSVLPRLFVVNVCLDSPKLATYHKGKREQTFNICFPFSYGVATSGRVGGGVTDWEVFDLESRREHGFTWGTRFKSCPRRRRHNFARLKPSRNRLLTCILLSDSVVWQNLRLKWVLFFLRWPIVSSARTGHGLVKQCTTSGYLISNLKEKWKRKPTQGAKVSWPKVEDFSRPVITFFTWDQTVTLSLRKGTWVLLEIEKMT